MTIKVTNPYTFQVTIGLDTSEGVNKDSAHIMPYAVIKLPIGVTVTANSKVQFPRLLIEDTQDQGA